MNQLNWKNIGPGLLYAGAAVGVSHLVQSTRAGAEFGFELVWVIVLAHIVKYPFFLMGPLYSDNAKGTILSGYKMQGTWALVLFVVLTTSTMFAVIAAIAVVTGGLAAYLFPIAWSAQFWGIVVIIGCWLTLLLNGYQFLDRMMKSVVILLSVATLLTFLFAWYGANPIEVELASFDWNDRNNLFFLIAFFGWMPAPMDISVWHSVWRKEKNKKSSAISKSQLDFHVGYFGTAILAFMFLGLGAYTLYGAGMQLESGGAAFSGQLIGVYTGLIGSWVLPIIGIAALITMFSTSITCLDAFPRSLATAFELFPGNKSRWFNYKKLLTALAIGSILILIYVLDNMRQLVDFATTISFLTTPLLALLNYRSVKILAKEKNNILPKWLNYLSIVSLLMLIGFAIFFISYKLLA